MNSTALATTHVIVVNIFLLIYLIKTILLYSNRSSLEKFNRIIKVPEMIVSTLFLVTGIWLFAILGAIKVLQVVKLIFVLTAVPLAVIGFKKQKKVLAFISFILIVGAYGLAEAGKNKPYIPTKVVVTGGTDDAAQNGIKVFAANCAMCHGLDGKKQYRDAADLSMSVSDAVRIDTLIRKGSKGKMPAFGTTLSDDEIATVESYIITLREK